MWHNRNNNNKSKPLESCQQNLYNYIVYYLFLHLGDKAAKLNKLSLSFADSVPQSATATATAIVESKSLSK